MREELVRRVLLVKAIEETDSGGAIISLADRREASREVLRRGTGESGPLPERATWTALPPKAQRLLAERADLLLNPLLERHPYLSKILDVIGGPAWVSGILLAISLAAGFSVPVLNGSGRIDVHFNPLILLAGWNLLIYSLLALQVVRRGAGAGGHPFARRYAGFVRWSAARLLAKSSRFDVRLAAALERFLADWFEVASGLLLARATRLFHGCAIALALGLVAGMYGRSYLSDYLAGWGSLFGRLVPQVVDAFYGPASRLTHIPLPDAARLEQMAWSVGGGEGALPWVHLLAASALIYIAVPRLALALWSSVRIWRPNLAARLPASIVPYYRAVLGTAGLPPGRGIVSVISYGYEPSRDARSVLSKLLPAAIDERPAVDFRPGVPYGGEDAFLEKLSYDGVGAADCIVLLMSLASTPEAENHGRFLSGVIDWLTGDGAGRRLLLMLDEGPYAARMTGSPERLDERRRAWKAFARPAGLVPVVVDLRPGKAADRLDAGVVDAVRVGVHSPARPS